MIYKQLWSEEVIEAAIAFMEASDHFDYHLGISKKEVIAWLKSLKQRLNK